MDALDREALKSNWQGEDALDREALKSNWQGEDALDREALNWKENVEEECCPYCGHPWDYKYSNHSVCGMA